MINRSQKPKSLTSQVNKFQYFKSSNLPINNNRSISISISIGGTHNNKKYYNWFDNINKHKGRILVLGTASLATYKIISKKDEMLINASENNNLALAKLLLKMGADVNAKDKYGNTPLIKAVLRFDSQSFELIKLLLEHGADVNAKNEYKETALIIATADIRINIIKLLLEYGADVNNIDKFGDTPLKASILKKDTEITELLIKHGANISAKDKNGYTYLQQAFNNDDFKMAKLLIEHGADINDMD